MTSVVVPRTEVYYEVEYHEGDSFMNIDSCLGQQQPANQGLQNTFYGMSVSVLVLMILFMWV